MPFEKQVCVFYAVLNNYFESIAVEEIKETENRLLISEEYHEAKFEPMRERNSESRGQIEEAIARFWKIPVDAILREAKEILKKEVAIARKAFLR